jgi:hypothetical protein
MGYLKGFLGGVIATIGIVSLAPAYAEVVTVPAGSGHGHFLSRSYSVPVEWVNSGSKAAGAYDARVADANLPPSGRIFGVELPEVPTWAMVGLGFAALGFAASRSRRRPRDIFS